MPCFSHTPPPATHSYCDHLDRLTIAELTAACGRAEHAAAAAVKSLVQVRLAVTRQPVDAGEEASHLLTWRETNARVVAEAAVWAAAVVQAHLQEALVCLLGDDAWTHMAPRLAQCPQCGELERVGRAW